MKLATAVACGVVCWSGAANATNWYPLPVTVAVDGDASQVGYVPLSKAAKAWPLCVSFPHMKDPFFLAANYGMVEEAKRLGVSAQFLDAGGYTELKNQITQIENCVASGAKAVIMVGIAADGMNNLLTELKKKNIPVVDAYNGVNSKDTGVRVLDSPRELALRTGQYFAKKFPKGGKPVKVARPVRALSRPSTRASTTRSRTARCRWSRPSTVTWARKSRPAWSRTCCKPTRTWTTSSATR
jgi:protein TorT